MMRSGGWLVLALSLVGAYACSGDDAGDDDVPVDRRDAGGDDGDGRGGDGSGGDGSGGDGSGGDGSGGDGSGGDGSGGSSTGDAGMIIDGGVVGEPANPLNPTGIIDGGWEIPEELLLCNGEACACADGVDNDLDGVADGFDIECTGPNDDDEGSFSTGISGDNRDPFWQDCFFDGNSGAGDDHCRYHTECLSGEREATSDSCTVSDDCINYCAQRTPNGCDCFGCCTITDENGDERSFVISDQCDGDDLDACQSCTPTDQCGNECGDCELCPGKLIEDLPDSCFPPPPGAGSGGDSGGSGEGGSGTSGTGGNSGGSGTGGSGSSGTGGSGGSGGTPYTCEGGQPLCFSQEQCPSGYYCFYACCTRIPVE
jgi:hypothetical protein